jgi:hypothetical protein
MLLVHTQIFGLEKDGFVHGTEYDTYRSILIDIVCFQTKINCRHYAFDIVCKNAKKIYLIFINNFSVII